MAIIMAVGGVFGVMNTMFASIAARIKEVGVLRILGFKRWQILISFMLESLAIGLVGGVARAACSGYLANGFEAASTLSGGQGGGKSVTLTMVVDYADPRRRAALHARDGPARRPRPGALGDADGDPGIAAVVELRTILGASATGLKATSYGCSLRCRLARNVRHPPSIQTGPIATA